MMVIERPLGFISNYLELLNNQLKQTNPGYVLSKRQQLWLGFCLSAIVITNTICWKRFERASLGSFKDSALSWRFRYSKIGFMILFQTSILQVLRSYGITEGVLCIDDVDRRRSKSTKCLYRVHKLKDKLTGGYCDGQSLVFLFLVTPRVSFPVGFEFYCPDPQWRAWQKEEDRLRTLKTPKEQRPAKPERDSNFPTKIQIALALLKNFRQHFGRLNLRAIVADGLYGTAEFLDLSQDLCPKSQIISKIRGNQRVRLADQELSISEYFKKHPPVRRKILLRGKVHEVFIASARLHVSSHHKKRFVVAIRYLNEKECRYLVASELSWRTQDLIEAYAFRWLIEVFFEDWKGHEGWAKLTKHPGREGSCLSVILSLMLDHSLLFHHSQKARIESKLPAFTVASLSQRIHAEALVQFVQDLAQEGIDEGRIKKLKENIDNIIPFKPSKKHMGHQNFPNMGATLDLDYLALAA
jgi:hypothetical protein